MAFDLNIKNIGKLSDAKVRIGRFTVLAGPNNTGKSFVSKILYSLFNALNANHAEKYIAHLTKPLRRFLWRHRREPEDKFVERIIQEIDGMEALADDFAIDRPEEMDERIPQLVEKANNIQQMFHDIDSNQAFERTSIPRDMKETLKDLQNKFKDMRARELISFGIELMLKDNLVHNFQVQQLSDLRGKEDIEPKVNIDGIGKFTFKNGEIAFEVDHHGLQQMQEYSNVIYLETPVYWKLKNALESTLIHMKYSYRGRRKVSGVPKYFYDLANALKYGDTGEVAFPSVYEKLIGREVIGGKIAISETGDLLFQENDRSYPLTVTAMGVTNLGILALLIERKVLNKDSFLFMDEPEAHLHPAWQVVMAESLFELAKGGANVVIATHSAEILKWLEVHVKKNPDDESLIALNKFPANGFDHNKQDFKEKMASIKQELTKPFSDLYMEGL